MTISRRLVISVCVFAVLGVFVFVGYGYESRRAKVGRVDDATTRVEVTNGGDRGPGTLREALFIAAAAETEATISVQVPKITLETALPPLVNSHGVHLVAAENSGAIDASGLPGGAILDVAGANASIEGIRISNCKDTAILLRASHFRLQSAAIEGCDVGVDIAENADEVLIEGNRFTRNRVGLRFAGSNRRSSIVKNEFSEHRDAAIWAVRGEPDNHGEAIGIRENKFTKERIGILGANVSIAVERNELLDSSEAAMQLMGTGAVIRGNRVSGGAAMGIIAENSRGTVIENNELDGLAAYGIMLKGSADALVRGNRVHNSGFGLAFVVGTSPSTAVDNTIIEPKFNGIDVIGDSPILRSNHVVRPRALALKVVDFEPAGAKKVHSQPFLEGNNFDANGRILASGIPAPTPTTVSR
jgi:parallel beta-helix repeat protein